ncbi:MAG: hypothetical protein HYT93_01180 [Parcubacteria group bacterium]|nr:hypothetical protein [Parcubacteria group bacterium]
MERNHFFTKANILKLALAAAIIIVLNLFFIFSIQLVYEQPTYDTFCAKEQVHIIPQTQDECVLVGGQWVEGIYVQKGLPRAQYIEPPVITEEQKGYCNEDFTCSADYNEAWKLYQRNVFIALVVLGTLTLVASFLLRAIAVVAPALAAGGVITLFIASVRYWSEMQDYLRVIILGIALVALLWAGVKKFSKN